MSSDRDSRTRTHQVGDQSEVEAFLVSPAAYGIASVAVERIDTHAAMVFLAGDRAYKIKRAVIYPYLDFSTLALREAACRHEVEINRRTAPEIYLGLCAIRRNSAGRLYLECGRVKESLDPVVEWAVEMRRFDREKMLDRLAEKQALSRDLLEELARSIAAFHAAAPRCAADFDGAESFAEIIYGNDLAFEEHRALFPRADSLALTRKSLDLVETCRELLVTRGTRGKVRHCHGDLHLANIVVFEGRPLLFDAIEFDDRIATIDVFYDLAFLLMDLWERGCEGAANFLFNRYLTATGDYEALPLLPLFLSARAAIRAKVSAAQGGSDAAQKYFRYALGFLELTQPDCVAIGGLSGSGKTSVSRALAPAIGSAPGAVHLRSDVIRKELFGVTDTKRLPVQCYSQEVNAQVYGILFKRADEVLSARHSVILDAVFAKPEERRSAEEIAARQQVPAHGFWLTAPKSVLKQRVAAREGDASDATPAVVDQQFRYDLGLLAWEVVESGGTPEALADRIQREISGRRRA